MTKFDRPHFQYPFRRGEDGKVVCVEQDTLEHIESCCQMIVRCPQGFRDDRPEFGWPFPEFHTMPINVRDLERALDEFEPRGRANASVYMDAAEQAVQRVSVDVEVDT